MFVIFQSHDFTVNLYKTECSRLRLNIDDYTDIWAWTCPLKTCWYPKTCIWKNILQQFCNMVVIRWTNTFTELTIMMSFSCSRSSRTRNVHNVFFFPVCIFFSIGSIGFHLPLSMHRSCFPCSTVIISIHKFSHFPPVFSPLHRRGEWRVAASVFDCQPGSTHRP